MTNHIIKAPKLWKRRAALGVCRALARGQTIDNAIADVGVEGFDMRSFRWACRKWSEVGEAYEIARADYLHTEADRLISLADGADGSDHTTLAVTKLQIDTRKWVIERLLPEYQPKQTNEVKGTLSLVVETGVPRKAAPTVEVIATPDIKELL